MSYEIEYEVEAILDHSIHGGERQWLVKWEGYAEIADRTWEPQTNVEHLQLWREYEAKRQQTTAEKETSDVEIVESKSNASCHSETHYGAANRIERIKTRSTCKKNTITENGKEVICIDLEDTPWILGIIKCYQDFNDEFGESEEEEHDRDRDDVYVVQDDVETESESEVIKSTHTTTTTTTTLRKRKQSRKHAHGQPLRKRIKASYPYPVKESDHVQSPPELFALVVDIFAKKYKIEKIYDVTPFRSLIDCCDHRLWKGLNIFCNPPYSDPRPFIIECAKHVTINKKFASLLIPIGSNKKYWEENVIPYLSLKFDLRNLTFVGFTRQSPFPCALLIFDPNRMPSDDGVDDYGSGTLCKHINLAEWVEHKKKKKQYGKLLLRADNSTADNAIIRMDHYMQNLQQKSGMY